MNAKSFLWGCVLVASFAHAAGITLIPNTAGSSGSAGSGAGTSETTANVFLNVDPSGSDSNDCQGTSVCLTPQIAIKKIPKTISHRVEVFIDAGAYTDNVIVSGFYAYVLDAGSPLLTTAPSILIKGSTTYTTFGLDGGADAGLGLATSYTAASGVTQAVMCDTNQNWHVAAAGSPGYMAGHFLKTSLNAATAIPITSNTNTCLTLGGNPGTIVGGVTTYQIGDPSTVITMPLSTAPNLSVRGNNAPISVQDIKFVSHASGGAWASITGNGNGPASTGFTCARCQFLNNVGGTASSVTVANNTSPITFSSTIIDTNRTQALLMTGLPGAAITFGGFVRGGVNATAVVSINGAGDYIFNATTFEDYNVSTAAAAPLATSNLAGTQGTVNIVASALRLVCNGTSATSAGLYLGGAAGNAPQYLTMKFMPTNFSAVGCKYGALITGQNAIWQGVSGGTSNLDGAGASAPIGIFASHGATLQLSSDIHTYLPDGGGTEMLLDGVNSVKFSDTTYWNNIATGTKVFGGLANSAGPTVVGIGLQLPSFWEGQFPDPADAGTRGMLLYGRDAGTIYFAETELVGVNPAVTGRWAPLSNGAVSRPIMSIPLGVTLAGAGAVLGYTAAPMDVNRLNVTALGLRLTTAGTVGSTNASIRISDGTSNCDCAFACNTANGTTIVPTCSTGCSFDAGVALTITDNSKGDCTVGPVLTVNSGLLWGTVH